MEVRAVREDLETRDRNPRQRRVTPVPNAHSVAVALLCLVAVALQGQERPLPDAHSFLQEVRDRLQSDDERQSGYVYVQTRRERKLHKDGRSVDEALQVSESYPGLPGERRWERPLVKDGRAVRPRDLEKADRERQRRAEQFARKLAADPEKARANQMRDRERRLHRRAEVVEEVFRVFDVSMLGREVLHGHDTIVFSLTPRPRVERRTRREKIMRKLSGRAWISESDYEVVRLEVESIDTITYGLGVLARVHKGSRASFQRRKIDDEWLPEIATYTFSARVGLVAVVRRAVTEEFSDYRRFNVDTSTTYASPRPSSR